MSFRRKLLLMFALAVALSVAAVTLTVSAMARRTFEQSDDQRTAALVSQFRSEFHRRSEEVVHRVEAVAASESAARMALSLSREFPDYGTYLNEAKALADSQQLDFLEFTDSQGTIISSAQWPAKFGYKDSSAPTGPLPKTPYLQRELLPDGAALGLTAIREVSAGDTPLYVIGGRRVDQAFLASLELPNGMRAMLYQNLAPESSTQQLVDAAGNHLAADRIAELIQRTQLQKTESAELVHWSSNPADDETVHAIPLTGRNNNELLGILLIGNSRRPYVELRQRIRSAAFLVGGAGILVAILLSSWAAARVTRPVEQLAEAAREVAAGKWNTQVEVTSSDELGELARAFNRMTLELTEQREKLLQSERVAAWRELARRLAHELKNPLFPLQLTVENLIRARQQSPEMFEEILKESSTTLLAEIANLKNIISRFSEFSKMPQPQFRQISMNEVVRNVSRLFQAQFSGSARPAIELKLDLGDLEPIAGDAELLHRALSNLVLNAMDAMPEGGVLTLRTRQDGHSALIEVSDTGGGLTPEEGARLFTPYYTSKAHGTGLGLAIVQSVVSDHGGRISVRCEPGQGATFRIELPTNLEKLQASTRQTSTTLS